MRKKIRLGICEWALPMPGIQNIKIITTLGLEGLVIDLGSYNRGLPLSNPWIQKEYIQAGKDCGISFPTLAVNTLCMYDIISYENTDSEKIVREIIIKAIDTAINMEIPKVYFPSFEASEIRTEKDFEQTVYYFQIACEYADKNGIVICSENTLSAEENLELVKRVGQRNFKIYFDTQNPYVVKKLYAPDMIKKLKNCIAEVHVKDGVGETMSSAMLGKGDSSFFESIEALKEVNYSGWIVLENYYDRLPLRLEGRDAFELVKKDLKVLRKSIF